MSGTSVTFQVVDEQHPVWSNGQQGSKDFYSTSAFNGQTMVSLAEASLSNTITGPESLLSQTDYGLKDQFDPKSCAASVTSPD